MTTWRPRGLPSAMRWAWILTRPSCSTSRGGRDVLRPVCLSLIALSIHIALEALHVPPPLRSLALDAASESDKEATQSDFADALRDCCCASAPDALVMPRSVTQTVASRAEGGRAVPTSAAPSSPQTAAPRPAPALRVGAAEFVPRQGLCRQPHASPSAPEPTQAATMTGAEGNTVAPDPSAAAADSWKGSTTEDAAAGWDDDPGRQWDQGGINGASCSSEAALELLTMWFPDYGRAALTPLLEASGGSLWLAVEELFLLEGEEPYSSRLSAERRADLRTFLSDAKPGARFSDAEFPSLAGGGVAAPKLANDRQPLSGARGQEGKKSARDVMMQMPPSGGRSAADTDMWPSVNDDRATATSFWHKSNEQSRISVGDDGSKGAVMMAGGVPVVATGAQLTKLYEEAREEAKENARLRLVTLHKVRRLVQCCEMVPRNEPCFSHASSLLSRTR